MIKLLLAHLTMLLCFTPPCLARTTKPHLALIDCGGSHFTLTTVFGQNTTDRLGVKSQRLSFGPDKLVDLHHSSLGLHEGLQTAEITGWTCIKGADGDILVLAYSCSSDVGNGCGGVKEWNHLVSPEGMLLDPGYRPEDDRTEGLLDRLGIKRQMRDGLSLQEVLE